MEQQAKTLLKYLMGIIFESSSNVIVKGGESSSQFQWFTIAKIKLQFLIFFVLILGLRLQRYSTNTKRCPPEKRFWKLLVLIFPPKPQ